MTGVLTIKKNIKENYELSTKVVICKNYMKCFRRRRETLRIQTMFIVCTLRNFTCLTKLYKFHVILMQSINLKQCFIT